MTLDEAIKHAEEVADVCEFEASKYDMTDAYENHVACQEGKCAEEHRQLAEWLKELKQLRNQTSWIPVSERLPDEEMNCLITDSLGKIHQVSFYFAIDGREPYFSGCYCVRAWMPLPEPYKAESEEA